MDERIKKIAEHYGYEPQSRQLIEEMAELTVAINKYWRFREKAKTMEDLKESTFLVDNIAEEIADVEIMLEQIKNLTGLGLKVESIKEYKLTRQMMRIKSKTDL